MRADELIVPSSVAGWLEERNHRRGSGGSFASRLSVVSRRAAHSRRREHRHENAVHRSAERGSLLGAVGRRSLVVVSVGLRGVTCKGLMDTFFVSDLFRSFFF